MSQAVTGSGVTNTANQATQTQPQSKKGITDLPPQLIRRVFEFVRGNTAWVSLGTCKGIRNALLVSPSTCIQNYRLIRAPATLQVQDKSFPKGFRSINGEPSNGRAAFACADKPHRLVVVDLKTGRVAQTVEYPEGTRIEQVDLQRSRVLTCFEKAPARPRATFREGYIQVSKLPAPGEKPEELHRGDYAQGRLFSMCADFSQNSIISSFGKMSNQGFPAQHLYLFDLKDSERELKPTFSVLPATHGTLHWSRDIPSKKRVLTQEGDQLVIYDRDTGKPLFVRGKRVETLSDAAIQRIMGGGKPICPIYDAETGTCYAALHDLPGDHLLWEARAPMVVAQVNVEKAAIEATFAFEKIGSLRTFQVDCWRKQFLGVFDVPFQPPGMVVFDISSNENLTKFPLGDDSTPISKVEYSPRSGKFLTCGETGEVALWDLSTGRRVTTFQQATVKATSLAPRPLPKDALRVTWDQTGQRVISLDPKTGTLTIRGNVDESKDSKDSKDEKRNG